MAGESDEAGAGAGRRPRRRARPRAPDAAGLFRIWHEVGELLREAERLGDRELAHFLGVTRLLIEERARASAPAAATFDEPASTLPN